MSGDSHNEEQSDAFAANDRWEAALGKYVRRFSDIEYASHWFARVWGTPDELAEARRLEFGKRCKYAQSLVLKYLEPLDPKLCAQWIDFFDEAILHGRNVRNKVLHNPLMVSVHESEVTGELSVITRIALSRRDEQYVTYEQLMTHLGDVHDLSARWVRLCINTTKLSYPHASGSHSG